MGSGKASKKAAPKKAAPKLVLRGKRGSHKPKPPRQQVRMTQALFVTICDRLAQGESLRQICRTAGMPAIATFQKWLHAYPDAMSHYARARELQAEFYADEIVEIADATQGARFHVQVESARTRIDARKWLASKLKPKSYGDKVQTDVTIHKPVQELSDDELAALITPGRGARTPDPAEG
ncbi:hypothetical protein [Acidiferrobacter sp.]|uniref:terminase small subunit-like protein n=1 Tax=Acidiferrobacter sp. TaxID=1872107 RepID=UPI00262DE2AB|nr:hypothetical protein [Acidiferrobacter sp.]